MGYCYRMRVSDQKLPLSNTLPFVPSPQGRGIEGVPSPLVGEGEGEGYFRIRVGQKGLTLVEVMIASVIVLILFLALMQSVLLSINMNLKNQLRDEAVNIAEERMRELRNLDFDALVDTEGLSEADGTETRNFRDFDRVFTIRRTIADLGAVPTDIKSITLSVSYMDVKDNRCSINSNTECTQNSDCPGFIATDPDTETCGVRQTIGSILRRGD